MTDIVAELRRLYEAAMKNASDLDETGSVLALNIAVVHHLPALLDVVEATRAAEAHLSVPVQDFGGYEVWVTERDRLLIEQRAALAALDQDGAS